MPPPGANSSPRWRLDFARSRVAFLLLSAATAARRLAIWLFTSSMACSSLNRSAARLGHQAVHLSLGGRQVRFRRRHGGFLDGDLNLVRLLVELHQHVPLLHAVVVVHQNLGHLARHPGRHEGHVAVDVSVVGGNRVQRGDYPRNQKPRGDREADYGEREQYDVSSKVRLRGWRGWSMEPTVRSRRRRAESLWGVCVAVSRRRMDGPVQA